MNTLTNQPAKRPTVGRVGVAAAFLSGGVYGVTSAWIASATSYQGYSSPAMMALGAFFLFALFGLVLLIVTGFVVGWRSRSWRIALGVPTLAALGYVFSLVGASLLG